MRVAGWSEAVVGELVFVLAVALGAAAISSAYFLIFLSTHRATVLTTLGCFLIVSASSVFFDGENTEISVGLRAAGIFALFVAACLSGRSSGLLSVLGGVFRRRMLLAVLPGLGIYLFFATAAHRMWGELALYLIGMIALVVALYSGAVLLFADQLRIAVIATLLAVGVASAIAGLLVPGLAIEGGRLRGIVENANLLGFFAFLLGGAALLLTRRWLLRLPMLAITLLLLTWTASRASALAVAVLVLVLIGYQMRNPVRVVIFGIFLGTAVALVYFFMPGFFGLFDDLSRSENSRMGSWTAASEVLSTSPWLGVGLGNEAVTVASSPLRAAVHAGILGLAAVVLMWLTLFVVSAATGVRATAVAAAAIVHSVFEGWLLSPLGPMLLIFCLFMLAVMLEDARHRVSVLQSGDADFAGTGVA